MISFATKHASQARHPFVFDLHEVAGAVADIGVFISIGAVLVVQNGLSTTSVLLPAGFLYLAVAFIYRLPIPVQPMKALGAVAIAQHFNADVMAAAGILLGIVFAGLGASGIVDRVARVLPTGIVRGIQLYVGILLCQSALHLVLEPPGESIRSSGSTALRIASASVVFLLLVTLRKYPVAPVVILIGLGTALTMMEGPLLLGPEQFTWPTPSLGDVALALSTVVLAQIPLTLSSACVGTLDAVTAYFGPKGSRVSASRLALTNGAGNLLVGAMGGMPLCHGSGGVTAHHEFGARTGAAPIVMGLGLILACVAFGRSVGSILQAFPVGILAAFLGAIGALHIRLVRNETGVGLLVAGVVGLVGSFFHLVPAMVAGLAIHFGASWLNRRSANG